MVEALGVEPRWAAPKTAGLPISRRLTRRMVGAARFELATPGSQGRCSTRLSYAQTQAACAGQDA
jgi:hypothetical protein